MNIPAANTTSIKGFAVFVAAVMVANFVLSQIEISRKLAGLNIGLIPLGDE